jgi:hypothetical protein
VAVLAVLRVIPAVIVLAADGRSLPTLPGYAYGPPTGDTYGFYAAARDFISSWTRVSKPLLGLAVLVLAAALAWAVRAWRRAQRAEAVCAAALALGLFTCIGVRQMGLTGAGAVGWPIVWSIPLFPLRVAGELGYHSAFYIGIVILLACNVITVVATALTARRLVPPAVALVAPALLVAWPFVMRFVEGTGNIVYGSWLADSGLLLYSEPLSTALVACAIALVVLRRSDAAAGALAGALMGLSVDVRITNALIAIVLFAALLLAREIRSAASYAVAGIGTVSITLAFWSKGYASFAPTDDVRAFKGLFSVHYVIRSWRDSGVFDWKMLAILLPLPLIGVYALRRRPVELLTLGGTVVVTAALYSAYYITDLHPRFLFVTLPPLFVLAAAGVAQLTTAGRGTAPREPGSRPAR